jgi:cyclopropane fatty-acyl-phospholipid synthase-like methyltransferase
MAYLRWRRAIELASLDHPWLGELLLRRRHGKPKVTPRESWDQEYKQGVYDRLRRTEQQHHHRLLAALITSGRQHCAVLEIGCGEGAFLESLLSHRDVTYVGVDFSPVAIERAQQRFACLIERGTVRFEVGDGRAYPAQPGAYDAVIFPECIEYLGEVEPLLDHYARALTADGLIGMTQWLGVRPLRLWRRVKAWGSVVNEAVVNTAWGGAWLVATLSPRRT